MASLRALALGPCSSKLQKRYKRVLCDKKVSSKVAEVLKTVSIVSLPAVSTDTLSIVWLESHSEAGRSIADEALYGCGLTPNQRPGEASLNKLVRNSKPPNYQHSFMKPHSPEKITVPCRSMRVT